MRAGWFGVAVGTALGGVTVALAAFGYGGPARAAAGPAEKDPVVASVEERVEAGRRTFRFDTFGDEAFWGDALRLHEAIAGAAHGGVGPGVSPRTALAVGLKVDVDALPRKVQEALEHGKVDLDDPATTLAPAAEGRGRRRDGDLRRERAPEVDGHPVRALPLARGRLVRPRHRAPARRLAEPGPRRRQDRLAVARPVARRAAPRRLAGHGARGARELGPGEVRRRAVPRRQGVPARREDGGHPHPARVRPRGREPPHLDGLGLGPVLERLRREPRDARPGHASSTRASTTPRSSRSPPRTGSGTCGASRISSRGKLADLQLYQLALAAPRPPGGQLRPRRRGARAERCSAAPRSAPSATSRRSSPSRAGTCTRRRRSGSTTSRRTARRTGATARRRCAGLWTHAKGGFYHDGRFATLGDVVDHYDQHLGLGLTGAQKADLVEYLKSL